MELIEEIKLLTKQITIVVSIHTALLVVYSYAHSNIDILYAFAEYVPVLLLLCLSPLIAVFFLSTQSTRQGVIVLLGVLPAELIYNIVTRFIDSPPIIRHESALIWRILYEGSFGLILILEIIGFWLTLKLLRGSHK